MEKALTYHEKGIEKEPEEYYKHHLIENYVNSLRLLAFAHKAKKNLDDFITFYSKAIENSKKTVKEKFEEIEFISDYN